MTISKLMVISKEELVTSIGNPERPILDFLDREKVGGIPNKIFSLIIITLCPVVMYPRSSSIEKSLATSCMQIYFKNLGSKKRRFNRTKGLL